MFCPICQAEYREGFTRCTDCGVDLVPPVRQGDDQADPGFVPVIWKGNDAFQMGLIANVLRDAGIDYYQRSGQLQNVLPPIVAELYELRVSPADLERALEVLGDLIVGPPPPAEELPAQVGDDPFAGSSEADSEIDIAELTSEAWQGEDQVLARFVADALRENSVAFNGRRDEAGTYHVLVHPENEAQAREIAVEIAESAPPAEEQP